jgi:hypothetical protein
MALVYYHGSKTSGLTELNPAESKVIDGESAVFAISNKYWAMFFIARAGDKNIESGFINNKPFLLENRPGAFKLLETDGVIYEVDARNFHDDERLGLRGFEFISNTPVKILREERVAKISVELPKYFKMITFQQKIDALKKAYF